MLESFSSIKCNGCRVQIDVINYKVTHKMSASIAPILLTRKVCHICTDVYIKLPLALKVEKVISGGGKYVYFLRIKF
jgi:hypothetical protein